jgi:aspartyl-tRNA synthetase
MAGLAWTASSCFCAARQNLREMAIFPMNQQALRIILMGAPSDATPEAVARAAHAH